MSGVYREQLAGVERQAEASLAGAYRIWNLGFTEMKEPLMNVKQCLP